MEVITLVALGASFLLIALVLLALQSTKRELKSLQESSQKDTPLLLLHEQMEHLREQVRASLEGSTQSVSQQLAQIGGSVTSQLGQVTAHLSERLRESAHLIQKANEVVGERLDRTARAVGDVQGGLARLDEAARRMIEVGQNINSLQQILQPPKLRGGFGETLLENLLARILPREYYMLQHVFRTGATVDAAIRIGDGLVPVDAKFPLENFKKMLFRAHVYSGRKCIL
ncbi:MAG: DNA recombination protein RmuC [Candidatus Tectomicrobia bacterium]|uniref:DNA recombination protein RmuC n=1 Tax=Tectimicrobiota bacterium TaxID=2528274 RepID=A0A932GN39_UNCTE|nr:DNA recombination protein RmuC [Candidatus Tectomicrobia bacterium]